MKTKNIQLPDSLKRIIEGIKTAKVSDCNNLIKIIKLSEIKAEDFIPLGNFKHPAGESYGRSRIYEGANFSVFLMSWVPGDFTAIHSHGSSEWGAVYFLGEVNHRLYRADKNKIELVQKGIVPEGFIAPVVGSLVHAMGNLATKPVMSLHIYGLNRPKSNANDDSLVYELEKKQIRTTDGSAFLNISEELCKKTEKGIITNTETVTDYFEIIRSFYQRNKLDNITSYIDKILRNPDLYNA